nr:MULTISPECIES: serine hydrolase domain-containing protein [Streptomyces]
MGVLAPQAASAASASAAPAARPNAVQQALNGVVRADGGPPAALASVQGRDGRVRSYTAGVADLATGAKVPVDGQVRIGSNTKAFVSVVVLQLVAEGKVDLDGAVDTYLPGLVRGDGIDGRRITVRQLLQHTAGGPLRDVTELDPSWGWAAGQMISTASDLDRFYTELLAGRILPDAQLAQMRATVPAEDLGKGVRYGLGLASMPLSCGGVFWGHGGGIPGFETQGGATEDGRAAYVAVTVLSFDDAGLKRAAAVVDTALCR